MKITRKFAAKGSPSALSAETVGNSNLHLQALLIPDKQNQCTPPKRISGNLNRRNCAL